MLAVSLNCPFLIAPSVFSNVYLKRRHIKKKNLKEWSLKFVEKKSLSRMYFYFLKRKQNDYKWDEICRDQVLGE
jgi:hypothetical protein